MVTSSRMVECPQLRGELFADPKVKMRLGWVQFYEKMGDFSLTSRRCGISRPTLRKWVSRYQELGLEGLLECSRLPAQQDECSKPSLDWTATPDDCMRLKVVRLYPNKESNSTLLFLDEVIREFPFPVQRFQTDRGKEFMAHAV
jgi:Helix-turn-helix domain